MCETNLLQLGEGMEREEKTETEALFACPDAECSLSKMECPSCGGTSDLNIEASGLQQDSKTSSRLWVSMLGAMEELYRNPNPNESDVDRGARTFCSSQRW